MRTTYCINAKKRISLTLFEGLHSKTVSKTIAPKFFAVIVRNMCNKSKTLFAFTVLLL